MALLQVEAEKLSLEQLYQGVIETIITSDQLFGVLPFIPENGKAYVYNREKTLGTADFVDVGDTINESAATFDKITTPLKRIIGDVDVDDFLQNTMSDNVDQAAVQIAKKVKVVGRKYASALINGDVTSDPKEFDGILKIVTDIGAPQLVDAATNGAALSFDHLDELIDLVLVGEQLAFIMNSRTRRSYVNLARALGGTTPEMIDLPGLVGPIVSYRGIPILKNDYVPIDQTHGTESAATTIFLVGMDEVEGLAGVMAEAQAGVEIVDVGPVQDKDAHRFRARWYTSLALHSTLALAAVEGINN